jgi:gas vesicle protein
MHHDHSSQHYADTFMSFAIGMAAGAAVALMFAPASGRETRAYLANKSRRAAEKGRQWAEEGGHALHEARETVTRHVSDAVEQGKRGYRDALHRGQDVLRDTASELGATGRAGE